MFEGMMLFKKSSVIDATKKTSVIVADWLLASCWLAGCWLAAGWLLASLWLPWLTAVVCLSLWQLSVSRDRQLSLAAVWQLQSHGTAEGFQNTMVFHGTRLE